MARRYSEEFKQGAVRLYRESGLGYRQIAADLGISAYALRQRVQRAGEGGAVAASSESEELQRLRRENTLSREEREISRTPAACLARDEVKTNERSSRSSRRGRRITASGPFVAAWACLRAASWRGASGRRRGGRLRMRGWLSSSRTSTRGAWGCTARRAFMSSCARRTASGWAGSAWRASCARRASRACIGGAREARWILARANRSMTIWYGATSARTRLTRCGWRT